MYVQSVMIRYLQCTLMLTTRSVMLKNYAGRHLHPLLVRPYWNAPFIILIVVERLQRIPFLTIIPRALMGSK